MTFSREAELLCRCARGRPDLDAVRALVQDGIDWPAFLTLADVHHLSPLCYRRLEESCPELVPQETLARLYQKFRRTVERNLFFAGELARILRCLTAIGVRALAFKGPVLAWWLYDHPGSREFSDLDILIDHRDLAAASALLAELGYHGNRGATGAVKLISSEGQVSLFRTSPQAEVDLHWELAPLSMGLSLNARSVWPRASEVSVAGRPVLTLSREDQVLYCALHGGKHGWGNLAWLADFSALIENRPPDWPRLFAEARCKRLSRALFVGLRLAQSLLGTPLPEEVASLLKQDTASAAIAREAQSFFLHGPRAPRFFPRELVYELRLTEGWERKARFFWTKITEPSSEDWQASRSARPFRLMRKYVFRLAGLA